MKKFFTQPIGEFSRQNSMVFLVCNIVLIAINFGSFEVDALGRLLNFVWGFSLFGIVISGYYLAEDHVPDFWKAGSTVLASVIVVGTFIEIAMPEYQENGFGPMYFFWAFNQLIYGITLRGTGIFRPVYENLGILGSLIIFSGTTAGVFFDYTIPETYQPVGLVGWLALVVGVSLGTYFAWGDKLSSSTE